MAKPRTSQAVIWAAGEARRLRLQEHSRPSDFDRMAYPAMHQGPIEDDEGVVVDWQLEQRACTASFR